LTADNLIRRFGPGVQGWLDTLPDRVERLTGRWNLQVVRHMAGNTSYTLLCLRGGTTPVVLKLSPDPAVAVEECTALRAWHSSPQVVDVLDSDLDEGALLLEGLEPGTPARDASLPVLVGLLGELHIAPTTEFRPLSERVDFIFDLARRRGRASASAIDRGHRAAMALADDRVAPRLLHGDLHQYNVLDAGARGLVAIDPRPCVGDSAFDAVDFALEGGLADVDRRISALSVVVDGDRLRAWCTALEMFFPGVAADHPDG
jgi:streptomycin 6-kinase